MSETPTLEATMTTAPVLTTHHYEASPAGALNLARLAFARAHRESPQYADWTDGTVLAKITRNPAPAMGTFSRYDVGDVVLAKVKPATWSSPSEVVAYCPRVGWNVLLARYCYELLDTTEVTR